MGWTSSNNWVTKADIIRDILNESRGPDRRVIKHITVGNNLWGAYQVTPTNGKPMTFVVLWLLEYDRKSKSWSYKDMDESCGPCEVNCPESIIKLCDVPTQGYAVAWRLKVADFHASRRNRTMIAKNIKIGDILAFNGCPGTYKVTQLEPKVLGMRADVGMNDRSFRMVYRLPMNRLSLGLHLLNGSNESNT